MDAFSSILTTLSFFFIQVVAVLVALRIHEDRKRTNKLNELRDYVQEIEEDLNERRIKIKVEIDQGMIFVYDDVTGDFMAHAKTYEELEDELRKKFPGKLFHIPGDQLLIMKRMSLKSGQIRSQETE